MIISYVNKEGRVISDSHFEEMVNEEVLLRENDPAYLEDYLSENYSATEIFNFSNEEKVDIYKNFQKQCADNARWDLVINEGWSRCEIDW